MKNWIMREIRVGLMSAGVLLLASTVHAASQSSVQDVLQPREAVRDCKMHVLGDTGGPMSEIIRPRRPREPGEALILESVVVKNKLWPAGRPITVAFSEGGYDGLKSIVRVANEWATHANFTFDFGEDREARTFRMWSPNDTRPVADIRVGFLHEGIYAGFWSYLGSESREYELEFPTMNLDYDPDNLPDGWTRLVRHEFGHAIGFGHEHQNPTGGCGNELRWEDDPGYIKTLDDFSQAINDINGKRPGVITLMMAAPDVWPSEQYVRDNLENYDSSYAYSATEFDPKSVMKYYYPADLFIDGEDSKCFSPRENVRLSDLDKAGVRIAYPE